MIDYFENQLLLATTLFCDLMGVKWFALLKCIYVIKYNPTHVIITHVWQGLACTDNYLCNHENHVNILRMHTKVGIQYILLVFLVSVLLQLAG